MGLFAFFATIILYGLYHCAVVVDSIITEETERLDV